MPKIRLNHEDAQTSVIMRWLNRGVLTFCWFAVASDITFYAVTANAGWALIFSMLTPIRYFFFDVSPEKIQRRPPSLDRLIPLTIFVRYLRKKFPIPQGNILASIAGFFLASGRAFINGYALLFFDTFTFAFQIQNTKKGVPLAKDITVLYDNDKLQQIEEEANNTNSEEKAERLKKIKNAWEQSRITNELTIWDFPLRRYLFKPTYYFKNKEVGNLAIDNKYILEEDTDEDKEDEK